jgi:nucleotide-binding universal stress UspA family protein
MITKVLVAADDSSTARRAVEAAAQIAAAMGSELHIVSAFASHRISTADLPAEFRGATVETNIDALLQELGFIAQRHGLMPSTHGGEGDPAEVIVRTAKKIGAGPLALGNKGMPGVRRVLGNVPNTVAHSAPCSVLIVDTTEWLPWTPPSSGVRRGPP